MTGRSTAIATSTRRTDYRRPTTIGKIEPGNNTESRSAKTGKTSGISTGWSPPALALDMGESYSSADHNVKATCL
jgi:hypothetical protein